MSEHPFIQIQVSGPEQSGKSPLIALIAHALAQAGISAQVQGAESAQREPLSLDDQALRSILQAKQPVILLTEMRTGSSR